jgi:hypothetical protein
MFSSEAAKDMIRDRVREAEAYRRASSARPVRAPRQRAKVRRLGSIFATIPWPAKS